MQLAEVSNMHRIETLSSMATLLVVIAAIAGAFGGCAAAAHHVLAARGPKQQRLIFFGSYALIGGAMGVAVTTSTSIFGINFINFEQFVLASLAAGFMGSLALAGTNVTMKFLLKRLGIEVTLTLRKDKENRRGTDE